MAKRPTKEVPATPEPKAAPPTPPKEVQVPDFSRRPERRWEMCPECKTEIFIEANGRQYYHKLKCSKSNGIDYRKG